MKHWDVKWDITPVCNMGCRHCYNADTRNGAAALSLDDIKRVADRLAPYAASISLLGGEPTCCADLEDIIRYVAAKGVKVTVVTNGVDIERLERALAGCQSVVVSIDGYDEVSYGAVRPAELFPVVVRNATRLARSIPVEISCVVHRGNFRALDQMVDLALAVGAGELDLLYLIELGAAQRTDLALDTHEEIEALVRLGERIVGLTDSRLSIVPRFVYPLVVDCVNIRYGYRIPRAPSPCIAGTRGLSINWHGEVFPCEVISQLWPAPENGANSLLKRELVDICGSDHFRRAFLFQAEGQTHKEWHPCSRCEYRQTMDCFPCPVARGAMALIARAEVESCSMALQMLEVELCPEALWTDGVVFNPLQGRPRSLNVTAREIFHRLREHGNPMRTVEEMTQIHPDAPADTVREDVMRTFSELLQYGIFRFRSHPVH